MDEGTERTPRDDAPRRARPDDWYHSDNGTWVRLEAIEAIWIYSDVGVCELHARVSGENMSLGDYSAGTPAEDRALAEEALNDLLDALAIGPDPDDGIEHHADGTFTSRRL